MLAYKIKKVKEELMLDNIKIKVPATSANLGPGFDCLGLALNLYANFTLGLLKNNDVKKYRHNPEGNKKTNLAIDCYWLYAEMNEVDLPRPSIHVESEIPSTRGLGSSAAFAVAGAIMAALAAGDLILKGDRIFYPSLTAYVSNKLSRVMDRILNVASTFEGHPDNAAPALWGGLVASRTIDGDIFHTKLPISRRLKFVILVPNFKMRTADARRVLPEVVDRKDASANLAYQAFLLEGLRTGRADLIFHGMNDKLHQPYRFPLIASSSEIVNMAKKAGALACAISGAGPSIMCILEKSSDLDKFYNGMSKLPKNWTIINPGLNNEGVSIQRLS